MKTERKLFSRYSLNMQHSINDEEFIFIRCFDLFSSISTESFYVLDILKKEICYIKPDDLFLCGFSVKDAFDLHYDFYSKILYSDDLNLCIDMYNIVLCFLSSFNKNKDWIDYFSCTFRLQRKYSFIHRPLPQMVCQRIKPIWVAEELHYLICSIEASTAKKAGNLCMYNKRKVTYDEYDFITKRWNQKRANLLSETEQAILILAEQAKSIISIADDLCKGYETIRNQIKLIFDKLSVHSIAEAINIASQKRMLYTPKQSVSEIEQPPADVFSKRTIGEMKKLIETHLDNGLSMRKTANILGVSEGTIRYWKNKEKTKN